MSRIIDFHTHVLPGIDDGSASVRESIGMLKMLADQGINHVIATPHFYARHDTPERFFARRDRAEAMLREEMEKHQGLPQLSVGAEVYFFPGMGHSDILSELTIRGKNSILIEMPGTPWTDSMYRELEQIYDRRSLLPIVAHVDRYIRPFRTHQIPQRLEQLPVLVQANASFFLQPGTRKMALKMLRQGKIHLLGSDCHNLTDRVPNLASAVEIIRKNLGKEALSRIGSCQDVALGNLEIE